MTLHELTAVAKRMSTTEKKCAWAFESTNDMKGPKEVSREAAGSNTFGSRRVFPAQPKLHVGSEGGSVAQLSSDSIADLSQHRTKTISEKPDATKTAVKTVRFGKICHHHTWGTESHKNYKCSAVVQLFTFQNGALQLKKDPNA